MMTLEEATNVFRATLPGWWWSVGNCSLTAHASCGPDSAGPDARLLYENTRVFDVGFHADLPQPATPAEALIDVMARAIVARSKEMRSRSRRKPVRPIRGNDLD